MLFKSYINQLNAANEYVSQVDLSQQRFNLYFLLYVQFFLQSVFMLKFFVYFFLQSFFILKFCVYFFLQSFFILKFCVYFFLQSFFILKFCIYFILFFKSILNLLKDVLLFAFFHYKALRICFCLFFYIIERVYLLYLENLFVLHGSQNDLFTVPKYLVIDHHVLGTKTEA